MKRRAILAGPFVVALVALVLLRSGDTDRREAAATRGNPFTGKTGVTRGVPWIAARQRSLDRHPAFERRLERHAVAREAAREEAMREEAAGVREKPEPGEEGGPPKSAGPAARQQRTGKAAIEPQSSLSTGSSFDGARLNESNFVPPDSMGSVGPTQILVAVNGRIKVFDKDGNPGSLNVTDSAFWAPVSNGFDVTDPGVEYDRLSGRWIVSAINVENSNNRVMLAVSSGPTITGTSSFTYFFFNDASPPPSAPSRFADYPQLGVDANAIYIGVNEFTNSSGGFRGTTAFVIRKSSLTSGGPIVVTAFRNLVASTGGGPGPDSPQPATDMDPNVDEGYIVGPDNQVFNRIVLRRITDPGGTPSISGNLNVTVPATSLPLDVPAQGTTGGLDALDDRLFEAMIGRGPDGSASLWTSHNIAVDSSGVGSPTGDRDAARWYQLGDLSSDPPTLTQSGTLFDGAVSNPRFFWIPSIAMGGQGHASLNVSTAGAGRHAEIASSGQLASDPPGTTEAFDITQSSTFAYNVGSGSPRRWGDYSQTVVDPNDNMTFWTFQEYANATNSWAVRVIKLRPPPPAAPSAASPSSVEVGHCSVSVQVSGTSAAGSGFFDPGSDPGGPGYPNHITADVTGGVIVNGVTYTDPTHVTLDLDTRAATTGPQDLTITNPDGQSETATGLITIAPAGSSPAPPCLNGTDPGSPANDNSPKVFGSAPAGSTVDLYADAGCSGSPVGSGTAADFAFPGITVTPPVADDSVNHFYATASVGVDVSACSSTLSPSPSASVTYVEDSTPPAVGVDSGPTGATTDSTPTFTFSATDAIGPIAFDCSIDAGTANFGACSGPGNSDTPSIPLAIGSYTFRVRATDAAGNSSVATRGFSVTTPPPTTTTPSPPDTVITKGPKKTHKQRPKFSFISSDPAARFQCKLDRGQFVPCTSPFRTPRLRPGKHKLKVIAIGSGGTDSTPAVRKFRVLPPG